MAEVKPASYFFDSWMLVNRHAKVMACRGEALELRMNLVFNGDNQFSHYAIQFRTPFKERINVNMFHSFVGMARETDMAESVRGLWIIQRLAPDAPDGYAGDQKFITHATFSARRDDSAYGDHLVICSPSSGHRKAIGFPDLSELS